MRRSGCNSQMFVAPYLIRTSISSVGGDDRRMLNEIAATTRWLWNSRCESVKSADGVCRVSSDQFELLPFQNLVHIWK